MREIEKLKEEILKEFPRLDKTNEFSFACHPGVPCYNECCGDVNIFLTPYDVIRLKQKLGIKSTEFLSKYTLTPFDENLKYPVILLKMEDNEKKTCPFVGKEGCSVYHDRPWACRMYPLGMASPKEGSPEGDKEFYFLLKEDVCKGFSESKKQTVNNWLDEQGIGEYNSMGEGFKELTLHDYFQSEQNLPPQKIEMFFLACYDLDRFRDFIFNSSFFDKFDIDDETKDKVKNDDVALLNFGHRWLRFSLFGEKTMTVVDDVLASKKEQLAEEQKKKEAE